MMKKIYVTIKRSYLFIQVLNEKIPLLNYSQSFHKQAVKILASYY